MNFAVPIYRFKICLKPVSNYYFFGVIESSRKFLSPSKYKCHKLLKNDAFICHKMTDKFCEHDTKPLFYLTLLLLIFKIDSWQTLNLKP